MNKLYLLFAVLPLFFGCDNAEREHYISKPRPQAELFEEAAEMKGLGSFIIGKTVVRDLAEVNKQIKLSDKYKSFEQEGFTSKKSWRDCPDVKQYSTSKFYIGDIEISYIDLHFYKDTLFEITCWASWNIQNAFTKKYGEGVKDDYRYVVRKKGIVKAHTKIVWENKTVIAKYHDEINSTDDKTRDYIHTFKMTTKSDSLLRKIVDCQNIIYNNKKAEQEKKRQESIDMI